MPRTQHSVHASIPIWKQCRRHDRPSPSHNLGRLSSRLTSTITRKLMRPWYHRLSSKLSSNRPVALCCPGPDGESPPPGIPWPIPFKLRFHAIVQPPQRPCILAVFQLWLAAMLTHWRACCCSLANHRLWCGGDPVVGPQLCALDTLDAEAEGEE